MILFDGVCHLCNGFVQFVLRRDPSEVFDFAPLQSDFARRRFGTISMNSIALLEDGRAFYAHDAVLRILSRLTPPWPWWSRIAAMLPRWLLAWGYRLVAKYRYRLFGKYESCALPPPGF